jgi:putative heme iron utilization protein
MSTTSERDHDRPTGRGPQPVIIGQTQSHAEEARTIVESARHATLCTLAAEPAGFPYGSIANFAIDEQGRPLLLLSDLAEHTVNLKRDSRASVLAAETAVADDILALGRVTLLGNTRRVPDDERDTVKARYVARHASAAYYADFRDFHFYRMEVEAIRWIGGFGRMSWTSVEAYAAAGADPLYPHRSGIIEHMNADHADALVLLAKHFAKVDASAATMTGVDRYGFEMQTTTAEGPRLVRLPFPQTMSAPDDVRRALIGMLKEARSA